jgi:hypothetical protein
VGEAHEKGKTLWKSKYLTDKQANKKVYFKFFFSIIFLEIIILKYSCVQLKYFQKSNVSVLLKEWWRMFILISLFIH